MRQGRGDLGVTVLAAERDEFTAIIERYRGEVVSPVLVAVLA